MLKLRKAQPVGTFVDQPVYDVVDDTDGQVVGQIKRYTNGGPKMQGRIAVAYRREVRWMVSIHRARYVDASPAINCGNMGMRTREIALKEFCWKINGLVRK